MVDGYKYGHRTGWVTLALFNNDRSHRYGKRTGTVGCPRIGQESEEIRYLEVDEVVPV